MIFDERMLVRSTLHRCEKGREERRMSLRHTKVRSPNRRDRSVREYLAAG